MSKYLSYAVSLNEPFDELRERVRQALELYQGSPVKREGKLNDFMARLLQYDNQNSMFARFKADESSDKADKSPKNISGLEDPTLQEVIRKNELTGESLGSWVALASEYTPVPDDKKPLIQDLSATLTRMMRGLGSTGYIGRILQNMSIPDQLNYLLDSGLEVEMWVLFHSKGLRKEGFAYYIQVQMHHQDAQLCLNDIAREVDHKEGGQACDGRLYVSRLLREGVRRSMNNAEAEDPTETTS